MIVMRQPCCLSKNYILTDVEKLFHICAKDF